MRVRSGTLAVLFTDMVGSTEQRARLGDAAADEVRRMHDRIVEVAARRFGGEVVKGTGDGAMVVFGSAAEAVDAAVAIQHEVAHHSVSSPAPVGLRVGISLGDVTASGGDVHGLAVNEAARVCARAEAGQVLISEVVRMVAGSRLGAPLVDGEIVELKGIPDKVRLWEVDWRSVAHADRLPFPVSLAGHPAFSFAGRSSEFARLRGAWAAATDGCRAVLVSGEPGAGKTRLIGEFAREAHEQSALVLYGACEDGLTVPFQPFSEACSWYCDHVDSPALGAYPDDLARLSGRVAVHLDHLPASLGGDPASEQHRLYAAVSSWLEDVARGGPVLVVVDDLHWASRETLLLLRHVLRAETSVPLLVVATYRDTDIDGDHPLRGMLADFSRLETVERICLDGLDADDVIALAGSISSDGLPAGADQRALAVSIHAETAGNALFVTEVLRDLAESSDTRSASATVPPAVRDVIAQRLARLGAEVSTGLQTAAVAGPTFRVATVAAGAGLSEQAVLAMLERTCRARLTDEIGPELFRFSHALVRSTLLGDVSRTRRQRVHQTIGLFLEESDAQAASELAYHWCQAGGSGDLTKAARYSLRAAETAMRSSAYDDAAQIAQRALDIVDPAGPLAPSLLVARGRAEDALGDRDRYQQTFAKVAELAARDGDPGMYAEAILGYVGRNETIVQLDEFATAGLERSLSDLGPNSPGLRSQLLGRLASGVANWDPDRGDDLSRQALALARDSGDRIAFIEAARARMRCWWDPLGLTARRALVEEMRAAAETENLAEMVAQSWSWEAALCVQEADMRSLQRAIDHVRAINEQLEMPYFEWAWTVRAAAKAISTGSLDEGEELMNRAAKLERHGFSLFPLQFGVLCYLRGRLARIVDLVARGVQGQGARSADHGYKAFFAHAAAESGRVAAARETLHELTETALIGRLHNMTRTGLLFSAGRAARVVGHGPWIEPLIAQCLPLRGTFATLNPGACSLGAIDGVLGAVHLAAGHYDAAATALTAAVEQNETAGLRPYTTTALVDLAEAYLRSGNAPMARQCGDRARDLATSIRMAVPLADLDRLNLP
jgi:class 3 adenylate cyclase/tetratricopeptide (TPR) repeat protein